MQFFIDLNKIYDGMWSVLQFLAAYCHPPGRINILRRREGVEQRAVYAEEGMEVDMRRDSGSIGNILFC